MNTELLFYFCLIIISGVFSKRRKILGGQDMDIQNIPYLAALVLTNVNRIMCGGCIITNKHILTAGHCVYEREASYNFFRVYVGMSNLTGDNPTSFEIHQVFVHPEYTGELSRYFMNTNDIAVVMISGTITFNEYQNKIDLPTNNYEVGRKSLIGGWGMTYHVKGNIDNYNNKLQGIYVDIIETRQCLSHFAFALSKEQFCTFHSKGTGICIGDSGSPVAYDNKVVGIVSCNIPCAVGKPDIHTNVYSYINFIQSVINKEDV